jgi:AcrR family transcriptional regulator
MQRLGPKLRRQLIKEAAVRVRRRLGIAAVTAEAVARECEVATSPSLVKHYFRGGRAVLVAATERRRQSRHIEGA